MKNAVGLILASAAMAACGGGGGGSPSGSTPVGSTSPAAPALPPPAPEVKLVTASLSRYAAQNTSVDFEVRIKPSNFTPTGTLVVNASDPAKVIAAPVGVAANADGTYTLSLGSATGAAPGRYTGNITLKLCADQACAVPQAVPSVSVPYDLTVLAPGPGWPGDSLTPLAPWTDAPEWSTFQGNPAHTAYVPVTIDPDQIKPRWKRLPIEFTATSYYGFEATIAIADGIFYGAGGTAVKARKEFDGSDVWSYDVLGKATYWKFNPPATANGKVYAVIGEADVTYLFAFDAATGAVSLQTPMKSQWGNYLAPVALSDAVYANGGLHGDLDAFDTSGGQMFFADQLAQTSTWSPAVDANSVYVYGGALQVLDRKTGVVTSTIKNPLYQPYVENDGAPVLGANGNVFAADYANAFLNAAAAGSQLMKFDTAKGNIGWSIAGSYPLTPAYANGVVYAPNTKPYRIEARAEADGALLWSWTPGQAGETLWNAEPIVTRDLLFVSTNLATYAIDTTTHKAVWSYPASGRLALSRSGILYIQNAEAVIAVNLK